ncbi:TraK family protein [Fluoribacter gormanii]|uniref:TraK family protein n=1 Tax=Fluoribacter gormanii TaxID=464 RepID=UPI002243758A|nr:TraK family protein [Fluoribacter gormanii]MCW8444704.1 TraK family protein [Fluoribacter gormanii]
MKKSLTENIMASKQSQQRTSARKNKVEFLALREDISEALEKGWSITVIWETLRDEGSFTATYNTFRLYVLKYLNGQKPVYSQKESVEVETKNPAVNSSKKKDISIPSFKYNPIPNIKDLL